MLPFECCAPSLRTWASKAEVFQPIWGHRVIVNLCKHTWVLFREVKGLASLEYTVLLTALVVQCHLLLMHVKSKQCTLSLYHNNRDKITLEATAMCFYMWPHRSCYYCTTMLLVALQYIPSQYSRKSLIQTCWDQTLFGWLSSTDQRALSAHMMQTVCELEWAVVLCH